ncbi:MAG: MaoC/PaaZ C-terminal domain-containing protein [Anaerolineae bacterium]|nr:MaoC/PaaZ C-terminal domain-containing protein [Anaerolineae bacterium]
MAELQVQKGRFFEEFAVGDSVTTAGRTITEADVVGFAALSGDWNSLHTDAEFAKGTLFGQRVAHGLLGLSVASGLSVRTGFIEGTVIAFREIGEWKFSKPIFIGDTIHVRATVTETKAIPRLGGGSVTFNVEVVNQHGQIVQHGTWTMLVKARG